MRSKIETLRTLGTIGAAAYILSQSSKVTQGITRLKQAQDIKADETETGTDQKNTSPRIWTSEYQTGRSHQILPAIFFYQVKI